MLTFQATYAGTGANKHLQELARDEVKHHARELWAAYRYARGHTWSAAAPGPRGWALPFPSVSTAWYPGQEWRLSLRSGWRENERAGW